jgi:hypothetical protein
MRKALQAIARLPTEEQDLLASRLLAELGEEDDVDRAIARSVALLSERAREASEEHRAGRSEELDPDRL